MTLNECDNTQDNNKLSDHLNLTRNSKFFLCSKFSRIFNTL